MYLDSLTEMNIMKKTLTTLILSRRDELSFFLSFSLEQTETYIERKFKMYIKWSFNYFFIMAEILK